MSKATLCESLRSTAHRIRGWSYAGDSHPDPRVLMKDAAKEIERLMVVYTAAADLCEQPFGQLNERDFYKLREAFYA